ncbi:type I glutamate--ammonia ligase [Nocardioides acrostichi]|uniref:Glutamine synthetase n=1 Tax=Nocardioides acrostichi TaxID=2784339 RepID=A0A930Y5A7_9ACTN|nr:glutamine synthetase family protein [Nocardioides acrostichi]MBF4161060.1 glutamine synthetase [Nocardioides acrostichi]
MAPDADPHAGPSAGPFAHDGAPADLTAVVDRLAGHGVRGVSIGWVDNNGIVRSRTVPLSQLEATARRGVGITAVFAVFDSHDGITFAHDGLSTPSGDVRLLPVLDPDDELAGIVPLPGQPGLAWVSGRQVSADGETWPYCQRAVLERQVEVAAEAGFGVRAGFEVEMTLGVDPGVEGGAELVPAHRGPAYSPKALLDVDEFVVQLLGDLAEAGVPVGQVHAEYGGAQVELAIAPLEPLAAADAQVLVRQLVHAAARAHGLRASLAPLTTTDGAGNGWHLHTSLVDLDTGANVLHGDGPYGLSDDGAGYVAGLLRELPGLVGVTAPSTGSLMRRRPHYWAGAYGCWGVENREAALRLVPPTRLVGAEATNVELKASDASANPYLSLAVVIAAGLAGVRDGAALPEPVQEDVGGWSDEQRAAAGIAALPTDYADQQAALLGCDLVRDVLGRRLFGAFLACRDADQAWIGEQSVEQVVSSLRWLY